MSGSIEYFDDVANEWDAMRQTFFSDKVREEALAKAQVKAGESAGDIGCGSGFVTEALLRNNLHVIAVDQSSKMLAELTHKFGNSPLLETRQGDADSLPIDDNTLDHVFANMYLHHVEDPAQAIREMSRCVRPGGSVIITDLDQHEHEFLREEHHDRWMGFAREDLQRWFEEAGLKQVTVESIGSSCSTTSVDTSAAASISIFLAAGRRPASSQG